MCFRFFMGLGLRDSERVIRMVQDDIFNFDVGHFVSLGVLSFGKCAPLTCMLCRLWVNFESIRKLGHQISL